MFFKTIDFFLPTKSWKNHPQKLLRIPQIYFFPLLPWLPKWPKQKNSCSKMWPIDQLYIDLGYNVYLVFASRTRSRPPINELMKTRGEALHLSDEFHRQTPLLCWWILGTTLVRCPLMKFSDNFFGSYGSIQKFRCWCCCGIWSRNCLFGCKSWKSKLKLLWPFLLQGFVFIYI